jgi:hypothetical protein
VLSDTQFTHASTTLSQPLQLLKDRTLYTAMNGNWSGVLNLGPQFLGLVGKKKAENHGVPFNLTEEFVSVYRMHMMLPDSLPVDGLPVAMTQLLGDKGAVSIIV